jgi:serine/tyrosine/threonine adenylyltransferase
MVSRIGSIDAKTEVGWQFDNTYSRLPAALFTPVKPAIVRAPALSILNHQLAEELGLNLGVLSPEAIAALFAGQDLPSRAQPIAQAYAGHQFGSFTMLGDGRAILLGEHRTPSGQLVDIQLKGAGQNHR